MILYLRRVSDDDIADLQANPERTGDFFFAERAQQDGDLIDFDKAWQALHFTLTGAEYATDDPLGAMLNEGEQVGEDLGYGRPWVITADRMKAFHEALSGISDDEIGARYNPSEMVKNDIYTADAFESEPEQGLAYLLQGVPALRQFAAKCASIGSGALVAIS